MIALQALLPYIFPQQLWPFHLPLRILFHYSFLHLITVVSIFKEIPSFLKQQRSSSHSCRIIEKFCSEKACKCSHCRFEPSGFYSIRLSGNNPEDISIWQSDAALPCNFFSKFYFDLKMPKMVFKQRYFSINNQTNCPFTVLSALFLFFQMLPFDSRLFPAYSLGVYCIGSLSFISPFQLSKQKLAR